MIRYQVVFYCSKTKETKMNTIINNTFTGAYAYAKSKMLDLNSITKEEWIIASIYDLEVEFKLDKNLT
jgi:hypothetical protein